MPPTLGGTMRGARLGYRWHVALGCYLRVSDAPDLGIAVELARGVDDMARVDTGHRVVWEDTALWWELGGVVRRVLAGDTRPRALRRRVSFVLDDDGSFRGWT